MECSGPRTVSLLSFDCCPLDLVHCVISARLQGHDQAPTGEREQHSQRAWDDPRASALAESLLETATNAKACAHLLASTARESGAWLNVLPISTLGLRMDDNTIRVATGLQLGTPLCRPHSCIHRGEEVDNFATHGLSCRWSEGRHHRHAEMNDIMKRALTSAKVLSHLEPSGLHRADGKHPHGITVVPWNGKLLIWDVTCQDTFAPSYSAHATREAGAVAERGRWPSMSTSPQSISSLQLQWRQWVFLAHVPRHCSGTYIGHQVTQTTGEEAAMYHLPHPEAICGSAVGQLCLSDGHHRPS